jgi:hypothetical protein
MGRNTSKKATAPSDSKQTKPKNKAPMTSFSLSSSSSSPDDLLSQSPLDVECILGKRQHVSKGVQYLVKFNGVGDEYNEWRSPHDISKELIDDYEKALAISAEAEAEPSAFPAQVSSTSIPASVAPRSSQKDTFGPEYHRYCKLYMFEHAVLTCNVPIAGAIADEISPEDRELVSTSHIVLCAWKDASMDIDNRVDNIRAWLEMFCSAVPETHKGVGTDCEFLELVKELTRHVRDSIFIFICFYLCLL